MPKLFAQECLERWDIHCISWYFMYILIYSYHLGIQLLQKIVCIYIYSTVYVHWWSLRLQYQVAFGLTRQFQWNSYSKWQYNFQATVPAKVIAIFVAYFIVICSINPQGRQPFYRYNCLVRLLRCFLHMVLCPFGYHTMMNLYWHSISFVWSCHFYCTYTAHLWQRACILVKTIYSPTKAQTTHETVYTVYRSKN